jgi:manganese transport protein
MSQRPSKIDDPKKLDESHVVQLSLQGVHGSVEVPPPKAGFIRQWRAFVGPAILVNVAGGQTVEFSPDSDWIRVAHLTLAPLLGTTLASTLFAVALLASGQSSTITGTLAGQVVMEGFMRWRIQPWVRRLITCLIAVVPAILIISFRGDGSITDLVNLSQVILCLELPFAMFPLLLFASSSRRMGKWRVGRFLLFAGWGSAILMTAMGVYSLPDSLRQVWAIILGH